VAGARNAGEQAITSVRRSVESRIADLIRRDPDRAANAIEVGLVDRDWLEEPGDHPIRTATPVQVVRRFLERSVEQRPSVLSTLGLNAIQLLSWESEELRGDAGPSPVAIVFTDLEGFTRFTAENGDDAAITLLDDHQKLVGPIVRSRGGRVVKHLGDGLMLMFPVGDAAVLAALELQGIAPDPLRLRAGVHLGDAVVTRDDVVGHVVNLAARVTEHAKGGQVLVTTDVRDAVGDLKGVRFGRARRARLKGVAESVSVCPVTAI
jgi:adenylate cyclase